MLLHASSAGDAAESSPASFSDTHYGLCRFCKDLQTADLLGEPGYVGLCSLGLGAMDKLNPFQSVHVRWLPRALDGTVDALLSLVGRDVDSM